MTPIAPQDFDGPMSSYLGRVYVAFHGHSWGRASYSMNCSKGDHYHHLEHIIEHCQPFESIVLVVYIVSFPWSLGFLNFGAFDHIFGNKAFFLLSLHLVIYLMSLQPMVPKPNPKALVLEYPFNLLFYSLLNSISQLFDSFTKYNDLNLRRTISVKCESHGSSPLC
ncbi:hypothetical protein CR513_61985, partial [Mucuna pruriens]